MRILLVYPAHTRNEQPINIMYISAVLKRDGHKIAFLEPTPYLRRFYQQRLGDIGDRHREFKKAFVERVVSFQPDLIGFSVMTVNYNLSASLSRLAKEQCGAKILWGGMHPTVDPEGTILDPVVDMICIGEGDEAVVELASKMENGEDITQVRNIWVRSEDKIYRNPVRPLIQDLDSLPYPDRELFASRYGQEIRTVSFITSRGCPFPCAYCQNQYLRKLYKGKGRFARYRSIENVVDEIKTVVSKYGCERVIFSDEMFTLNKRRVIEFCSAYQREVGLPFLCQTRPTHVDEEVFIALKEAGCEYVSMAIEAGNDHQRNAILKRNVSEEAITEAFSLAHKIGLKTGSFNMVGVPYETEATIWDTININRQVQPDLLMCTIFMPFSGTEIGERCEQEGWVKGDVKSAMDYYSHATLELPTISSHKLVAYQMLFNLYVRLPRSSYWAINILRGCVEKIPTGPGFVPWFLKGLSRRLIALMEKSLT